jgi:hypothetical protein
MHINLVYIAAAILLFILAFLHDYNIRQQEKLAQKDCVKELRAQLLGRFPYNQRNMFPLRRYISIEMSPKYEQMRLDGYQLIDIRLEMQRDAENFVKKNMQESSLSETKFS